MADGHDATLISKDRDANAIGNGIFTSVTDGVEIMQVNADGSINVVGSFASNAEYAEDTAHTTADVGNYVLTVRQDTLASSTTTNGDYASFKSNAAGALKEA